MKTKRPTIKSDYTTGYLLGHSDALAAVQKQLADLQKHCARLQKTAAQELRKHTRRKGAV